MTKHTHAHSHTYIKESSVLTQSCCLHRIQPLPFGPHIAEGGNGADSSNGPYQASRQQHPWAEQGGSTDRYQCDRYRKRDRGGGSRARRGRGEERFRRPKPHLLCWFATSVYPCWNKDCQPSSACPTLKPPPTRPASRAFTRMAGSNTHTHVCAGFCIFELKKRVEQNGSGEGDDQ